jgi:hypothetical protein
VSEIGDVINLADETGQVRDRLVGVAGGGLLRGWRGRAMPGIRWYLTRSPDNLSPALPGIGAPPGIVGGHVSPGKPEAGIRLVANFDFGK